MKDKNTATHSNETKGNPNGAVKASAYAEETPVQNLATPSYSILAVDDNDASAQTLGWMMEALGHKVELAYSARAALSMVERFKPDIIMLDIGMPDMNGYELCREMQRDATLKDTVFIAQTGWGQEEHLKRSKGAGFDFHLTKPISFDALQCILEQVKKQP